MEKLSNLMSSSLAKVKNPNLASSDQSQQQHQQQPPQNQQLHSLKQNEFEPKNIEQTNSSNDIDAMLNDIMLPDTRIFASLLSKDFNNNNRPLITPPQAIKNTKSYTIKFSKLNCELIF